jgi:hypothetical protein
VLRTSPQIYGAYNAPFLRKPPYSYFAIFIREEANAIRAGLIGNCCAAGCSSHCCGFTPIYAGSGSGVAQHREVQQVISPKNSAPPEAPDEKRLICTLSLVPGAD